MTKLRRVRIGVDPVVAQLVAAAVGGVIVIGIAILGSGIVSSASKSAARESNASLVASQISAAADAVAVLHLDQSVRQDGGLTGDTNDVPIRLDEAIAAHDALTAAGERGGELHRLIGSEITLQIWGATGDANAALDTYFAAPTRKHFDDLQLRLQALRSLTSAEMPGLTASAQANQSTLLRGGSYARAAIVIATIFASIGSAATTLVIGRRLRNALRHAEQEKERLIETSRTMQRRNDQFGALYQVVTEVSESLNMRYVVRTAIREARKLVGADVVGLRRLEQSELILAGVEHDDVDDVSALSNVPLGVGIVGRAAKRGKTIRIDDGAEMQMSENERIRGIASGIVVPLIVGARVVGTLGCWSRSPNHFDVDDERILEMMASQVATAIAAADVYQETDRDAHRDALTALPNRRQLHEDLASCLPDELAAGNPMTVAMIDIDNFKRFNDDFGHKVGDITLQKVAEVLRNTLRDGDRVYRFGGEEFLVVFRAAGADLGSQLCERLRAAVERTVLTGEHLEPVGPVTISVGLASYPDHGGTLDELIDLADRAMYASKEAGRNRVAVSGEIPYVVSAAA